MSWPGAVIRGLILCCAVVAGGRLLGQQPRQSEPPPRYRRIYVPAEDLASQVRGLLPVKREEFDRRIATAAQRGDAAASAPRIAEAHYSARLEGQSLVDGKALWQIVAGESAGSALSLDPCNLSLGDGQWDESPARPVVLGIGPKNKLTLLVDAAATASVAWSRRGRQAGPGLLEFDLSLPPAGLQTLRLELPEQMDLICEPGLATRLNSSSVEGKADWLIELGGVPRTTLRLINRATAGQRDAVLIKEQSRYLLTLADISVEVQWQVEVLGGALRSAQLQLDPRLTVITVQADAEPVAWSMSNDPSQGTLSVEFPQPLTAGSHSLSIRATARHVFDAPWRLPRIVWPGATWQEGSARISVPESMQAAVTATHACRPVSGAPLADEGEDLGFQFYGADAYVELRTLPRQPRLSAAAGVAVQFDASQISATLRAELTSQRGDWFEVDVVVSNEWIVDSVETSPPELLDDRPVVAQGESERTMRLKLLRPITPGKSLKLMVRARRQQPFRDEVASDTLWQWLRFPQAAEQPTLLALGTSIPNLDVQVTGDLDAVRLDPKASPPEDLALLDAPAAGLLFRLPPEAGAFHVQLTSGEPRYAASWNTLAACSRTRVKQTSSVRCVPAGPGISRLIIRGAPAPTQEIRWRLAGTSDAAVIAQTRKDTPAAVAGESSEAVWELEFSRPLTGAFDLETAWEAARSARQSLVLFSCVEAGSQTGEIRVQADDDSRWLLDSGGLQAVPMESDDERFSSIRAAYRYEPSQRNFLSIVAADPQTLLPLARILRAGLQTRFAADGSSIHTLSLDVENTGLTELGIRFPDPAQFQEAVVDGHSVEMLADAEDENRKWLPLPAAVRRTQVRITFTAPRQDPIHYVQAWSVPLPTLDLEVPPLRWEMALPPGVEALREEAVDAWEGQWRRRFLGGMFGSQLWLDWLHPWGHPSRGRLGPGNISQPENASGGDQLPVDRGWTSHVHTSPWRKTIAVNVHEPRRTALASLAVALAMAGMALATARRWTRFWLLAAILIAAAAWIVPLYLAPLTAGALWGIVAASLAGLLRPLSARRGANPPSRATTARWLVAGSASAMLLGAILLAGELVRGQEPAPEDGKAARPVPRVVIAVDADRRPSGDYVYLDDELYEWLFREPESQQAVEPWQLREAAYHVRWPTTVPGTAAAAEVRASLEIETSAAETRIVLPFHRQQALLQPPGARLDGTPLAMTWSEDGQSLSGTIAAAGRWRLEIPLACPLQEGGGKRRLQLSIPRAPQAAARVEFAAEPAPPLVASGWGMQSAKSGAGNPGWQVDLGSVEELSLEAPSSPPAGQVLQATEVDQLFWWQVRPGSVMVDAVFKFRPLMGTLRELQVRFDPRLRLLPTERSPQVKEQWIEEGTPRTLHVMLAEPATGEFELRTRFLLVEASGVGKILLPTLSGVAGRTSRRWLGISPGPGIELLPPAATPISAAEFAQAVGIADVGLLSAFDLASAEGRIELEFRPESSSPTAATEATLQCALKQHRLRWAAQFSGLAPQHFQQRVQFPPGWTVTQVLVHDGDLPVRRRWFEQPDGILVVRMDHAPGSSPRLQIDAVNSAGSPLVLPAVKLLDAAASAQSLRLYRGRDCVVQILENRGWTIDAASPAGRHEEGLGRLVANLSDSDGSTVPELKLQVAANRPQVTARMLSRCERPTTQAAELSVFLDLDVAAGQLDALRLEVPPELAGPWQLTPPMTVQSIVLPGDTRRQMTLTPELPLAGRMRLVLQTLLVPRSGQPLRVPEISLVDVPQVERFVQLGAPASNDETRWRPSGLQAAALPIELQAGLPGSQDFSTYAPLAQEFEATFAPVASASAEPLVSLAEYRVELLSGKRLVGEAVFHYDPAGRDACTIELPAGYQATLAILDGAAAQVERVDGHWRVAIPPGQLPQRLTVGYIGQADFRGGVLMLSGPTLIGAAAERSVWQVRCPDGMELDGAPLPELGEVTFEQDLLRLSSTAALLKRASQRDRSGISSESLAHWLTPWLRDVAAARQRAEQALKALVIDRTARVEEVRRVTDELDRQLAALGAESPAADGTIADIEHDAPGRQFGGAFPGPQPQLVLHQRVPQDRMARAGLAIALSLLGVGALLVIGRMPSMDWLAASAPFGMAVLGMVLAVFSPLGVVAAILPLAAMWIVWHSPWATSSRERHSSVVSLSRR